MLPPSLDVGAAAGHVSGDRYRTRHACLRNDIGFLLVVTGVQDLEIVEAGLTQLGCQQFRLLDRGRADQNRLAALVGILDLGDDRLELFVEGPVDLVVLVDTLDRQVGRHFDHFELVDIAELFRFGLCRTGHAGKLSVHAEIVLEGDRGERLVLRLDLYLFLGFERLVLAFRIAAAGHHATREFVDDDDLVVADDVVLVAGEELVGLQRVIDVVDDRDVLDVVEGLALEQAGLAQQVLELFGAGFGEVGGALLFVDLVIFRRQHRNEGVDRVVEFRTVVERAGNDQRRTRLVDQDRVHFVDDRIIVAALDHLAALILHVIAQIIEAELVVGGVGDVAGVVGAALVVVEAVDDDAGRQPEKAVELAHRVGVALGQVVVDGDHMHALAGERIEIDRQGTDEGLAFAGLHLGNRAIVKDHAAGQLHVERAHAEHAAGSLAHDREGRDQDVVERLAFGEQFPELHRLGCKLFVGESLGLLLDCIDGVDSWPVAAHAAIVSRTEQFAGDAANADHTNGPF